MKFTIGQTVSRQDPGGHETTFSIKNIKDQNYHTALQGEGYKYEDVSKREDVDPFTDFLESQGVTVVDATPDFDLPIVEPSSTKPRLHQSTENICVSCEG